MQANADLICMATTLFELVQKNLIILKGCIDHEDYRKLKDCVLKLNPDYFKK